MYYTQKLKNCFLKIIKNIMAFNTKETDNEKLIRKYTCIHKMYPDINCKQCLDTIYK